ncbi:MAG: hypothetical protein Q4G27_07925 [Flavobacteriaceae bacterium]|nr:hypothetical protein [Flavobacteriaceae bacterium]
MKYVFSVLCGLLFILSSAQDNRSFQQINDSILAEAHLIYKYDKAFTMAMNAVEANRKLSKSAGEILVMPKNDTIYSLVFDKENPKAIVAEMKFNISTEDSALMAVSTRAAKEEELVYLDLKHKIMANIQSKYSVDYGKGNEYLNPIFFPFTEKIRGQEIQLYKFYLTTETSAANTIPFGRDYMFIAKEDGSVIYNLQFNTYMPVTISQDMLESETVEITYPEREHYMTPTDIFLFTKYGAPKGISFFRVVSTYLANSIFHYDWERDTLDVVMPEE